MLASILEPFRYLGFVRARATGKHLFSDSRIAWRTDVQRYLSDPEFRRQELDRNAEYTRLRKIRDPKFHADRKLYHNKVMRQRRSVEGYLRFERLSNWVRRSGWHKADLPWKEYRPILYSEKTTHRCSRCDWQDYRAKLWWSTIGSQGSYVACVGQN